MTETTIANLTAVAAAEYGQRAALVDDEAVLTWSEVEGRVAALAAGFSSFGVKHGDRVVLSVVKSVSAHITVHALLRIGAVVVPIDPRAPALQAAQVAESANAQVAVADATVIGKRSVEQGTPPWRLVISATTPCDGAAVTIGEIAALTAAQGAEPAAGWSSDKGQLVKPHHEAYIIFTSGSTGRPKGIVHTHASAFAYATVAKDVHALTESDIVAGTAPLHFDMSTLELYAAPLAGSAIAPVPDSLLKFPASVVDHSRRHEVTVWYTVPTLAMSLVERGAMVEPELTNLRLVAYAGEPYPPSGVRSLMEALPRAEIHNAFGPAETNVVSVFNIDQAAAQLDAIPIGEPWPGAQFLLEPLEAEAGEPDDLFELWLAAPTMMKSYLGMPELTASRTRSDPGGTLWYQTGDIVAKTERGVVFVGRTDHQVKIRGVRLELEAIEAFIEQMSGVGVAVAAALPPSNPSAIELVVLADEATTPSAQAVRRHAASVLNQAAIPSIVHFVDEMPVTQSGKIDRARVRRSLSDDETTPRNKQSQLR